ncbi:hypothetical protein EHQ52_17005 [Leptospira koniambonensis]|uniref:HEPN domain-containing protein n=1 Tax=Leptospira koniambonensis TaxID=2484950 RepID=A0A4V3JN07_9LEPT|nr:hypothetical protein [Leptospira koniambonensis]TGL31625.1 hypothetical protein EHQ52_17005 [Leptospira koniambonensis]
MKFPNWEFNVREISNNYYRASGLRNSGNIVSCDGTEYEEIISKCLKMAEEIELQISEKLNEKQ